VGWGKKDPHRTPLPEETESCLIATEPSPFVRLLSEVVVGLPNGGACNGGVGGCAIGNIKPYNKNLRQYGNDWPPFGYTMTGVARVANFRAAIEEVERNDIGGAIVELGVWRGGGQCVDFRFIFRL
jgi:hypothetical protein